MIVFLSIFSITHKVIELIINTSTLLLDINIDVIKSLHSNFMNVRTIKKSTR